MKLNLYSAKAEVETFENDFGLLVDPPRSGLKNFVDKIKNFSSIPKEIIYVSCFAQSLSEDIRKFIELGYEIKKIVGVDQFAQTPHCEWIVHLIQKP
ncbi:MAG: hypothetical protein R2827_07730 [Bdellovibrionales bacterium]